MTRTMNPIGIISMQHARPFTAADFPQLARWKAAGFDFVEFLVPEAGALDLAALRRALDDAGLGALLTARVTLERDPTGADAACRRRGVDYLHACLEACAVLGAPLLTGPLYGSPLVFAGRAPHPIDANAKQARLDWGVDGLRRVGEAAAAAGIRLGIEPINRYETDFLNTTRQGVDLVRRIDLPSVGLVLDTFHMNIEDDGIDDAIRHAGAHLFHFQANENHRGYLGTGHVDWTATVRALADVGYRGPITLEPFRRTDERIGTPFAQWKPPMHDEQAELTASCGMIRSLIALNGGRT